MTGRSPFGGGSARSPWRMLLRGLAATLAVLALSLVTACSGQVKPDVVPSAEGVDAAVVVTVIDNRYEPALVEIEVGDAVRWEFRGSMEHDVVGADGSFVSDLTTKGSYTYVFDTAGEFAYDCSVHPEMTGLVRVK
ncbi:cupredoxin domain-containing protein [Leucobacter sp. W1038]|uniref:cupredoxin domain-containing protein n=1 Tax=Leucobacter sp. W1038 TaxID=3438281 RepID=UPI003D957622